MCIWFTTEQWNEYQMSGAERAVTSLTTNSIFKFGVVITTSNATDLLTIVFPYEKRKFVLIVNFKTIICLKLLIHRP